MDILILVALGIKFKIYTVSIVSVHCTFPSENKKLNDRRIHKTSSNHKK